MYNCIIRVSSLIKSIILLPAVTVYILGSKVGPRGAVGGSKNDNKFGISLLAVQKMP